MIGLPTETMDDVNSIIELGRKVKTEGKLSGKGGEVNVSVSSFVPKAHTPFQWEPQIGYEEILGKQEHLRHELKRKKLNFKWHDAPLSVIEGAFARGDRRLGDVLVAAQKLGCRFDSWGDHFSFSSWQKAFAACGIDPRFYLRRRELDEILPWDHIDSGVTREFLLKERQLAIEGALTPDCRTGTCSACGVCDFKQIRMHTMPDGSAVPSVQGEITAWGEGAARIRIRFTKTGSMRYLSHLEMINLFTRAVARGGIPVRFSQGFHPHPKFSFATALSVGVESRAEYLDLEVAEGFGADDVRTSLNAVLPQGMTVLDAREIPLKSESLSVIMEGVRYRVSLPQGRLDLPLDSLTARFLSLDAYPYHRTKKGGAQDFDLREGLKSVAIEDNCLELVIDRAKPLEYVTAITGIPLAELGDCSIEKLEVIFKDSSFPI